MSKASDKTRSEQRETVRLCKAIALIESLGGKFAIAPATKLKPGPADGCGNCHHQELEWDSQKCKPCYGTDGHPNWLPVHDTCRGCAGEFDARECRHPHTDKASCWHPAPVVPTTACPSPLTCTTCHSPDVKRLNPHSDIYKCRVCTCEWIETYRKPDELPRLQALALDAARIAMRKLCERIEELEAWNNTLRSDMAGLTAQAQAQAQALQTAAARHRWHPASEMPTRHGVTLLLRNTTGGQVILHNAGMDWESVVGTYRVANWREIVPPESEGK